MHKESEIQELRHVIAMKAGLSSGLSALLHGLGLTCSMVGQDHIIRSLGEEVSSAEAGGVLTDLTLVLRQ